MKDQPRVVGLFCLNIETLFLIVYVYICYYVCVQCFQPVDGAPGQSLLGVCFIDTCIGLFHVSESATMHYKAL